VPPVLNPRDVDGEMVYYLLLILPDASAFGSVTLFVYCNGQKTVLEPVHFRPHAFTNGGVGGVQPGQSARLALMSLA
jgi:hypothetical protein